MLCQPLRQRSPYVLLRCRELSSSHSSSALPPSTSQRQNALLLNSRAAERARFGVTVWQLLGAGLVGVGFAAQWWSEHYFGRRFQGSAQLSLASAAPVVSDVQARALLSDVRRVLERHGIGLGCARLDARVMPDLMTPALTLKDRATWRRHLGTSGGRRVDFIAVRSGLTALVTSHMLAHEFMRSWLWLQGKHCGREWVPTASDL